MPGRRAASSMLSPSNPPGQPARRHLPWPGHARCSSYGREAKLRWTAAMGVPGAHPAWCCAHWHAPQLRQLQHAPALRSGPQPKLYLAPTCYVNQPVRVSPVSEGSALTLSPSAKPTAPQPNPVSTRLPAQATVRGKRCSNGAVQPTACRISNKSYQRARAGGGTVGH